MSSVISLLSKLPALDLAQGEPRSFSSLDGTVYLHVDLDAFDFYIDAHEDYVPAALAQALTQAEWWGLEPIEEDDPHVTDEGVRIYLTPIIPVEPVMDLPAEPRTARLRLVAAAMAGVLGSGLALHQALDLFSSALVAA